jgi:hypothetical protein
MKIISAWKVKEMQRAREKEKQAQLASPSGPSNPPTPLQSPLLSPQSPICISPSPLSRQQTIRLIDCLLTGNDHSLLVQCYQRYVNRIRDRLQRSDEQTFDLYPTEPFDTRSLLICFLFSIAINDDAFVNELYLSQTSKSIEMSKFDSDFICWLRQTASPAYFYCQPYTSQTYFSGVQSYTQAVKRAFVSRFIPLPPVHREIIEVANP